MKGNEGCNTNWRTTFLSVTGSAKIVWSTVLLGLLKAHIQYDGLFFILKKLLKWEMLYYEGILWKTKIHVIILQIVHYIKWCFCVLLKFKHFKTFLTLHMFLIHNTWIIDINEFPHVLLIWIILGYIHPFLSIVRHG